MKADRNQLLPGLYLTIVMACSLSVPAATVTNCDETSLRVALASGGAITFDCNGTITLTNTVRITNSVTLDSTGHNVTISGGDAVRIFYVQPGVTLRLLNLTIANGRDQGTNGDAPILQPGAPGGPGRGGAIYNDGGTLIAEQCRFRGNIAKGGKGADTDGLRRAENGGVAFGGALFNAAGQLSMTNCTLDGNTALGGTNGVQSGVATYSGDGRGGAIYSLGGQVVLNGTVFTGNSAAPGTRRGGRYNASGSSLGGAIHISGASLVAQACRFFGNKVAGGYKWSFLDSANARGGAFYCETGSVVLAECYFSTNAAMAGNCEALTGSDVGASGEGGAVHIASGNAGITNGALTENHAIGGYSTGLGSGGFGRGGAIFNAGNLQILNCTFFGNIAKGGDFGGPFGQLGEGDGGGISNTNGNLLLVHATLSANVAVGGKYVFSVTQPPPKGPGMGGGIWTRGGLFTLHNAIVAHSAAGTNCSGVVVDGGHNISSDGSCNFTAPGSLNNTDPVLGPLADYGGPTPTMALLAGSPAIDAADAAFCPPTDQRGIARPFGDGCDIGAFESSPPYTILGQIQGYTTAPSGINVSAGFSSSWADSNGNYALHGFTAGSFLVTPNSPEAVFILSNRVVNVGPDAVGVNFYSYRSNALTIERITNGTVRSVFAGEAGQTYQVLVATNLPNWSSLSIHIVEPSGIFEFFDTNSASPASRFFEVVKP